MGRETEGALCVSDEQYIGTALSYILETMGEDISNQTIDRSAFEFGKPGVGYEEHEVSGALLRLQRGCKASSLALADHWGVR